MFISSITFLLRIVFFFYQPKTCIFKYVPPFNENRILHRSMIELLTILRWCISIKRLQNKNTKYKEKKRTFVVLTPKRTISIIHIDLWIWNEHQLNMYTISSVHLLNIHWNIIHANKIIEPNVWHNNCKKHERIQFVFVFFSPNVKFVKSLQREKKMWIDGAASMHGTAMFCTLTLMNNSLCCSYVGTTTW